MSSILETFYILFKSNSAEVEKGAEGATKSTKAVNASLKETDDWTKKVGDNFVSMGDNLATVITDFLTIGAVISGFKSSLNYVNEVRQASRVLNINAGELDAWGSAVRRNGGTVEGFQNSLKTFANDSKLTNKSALAFLLQYSDYLKDVKTKEQGLRFLEGRGIDDQTILFLMQGSAEIKRQIAYQKELGVVTDHNTAVVGHFNKQWDDSAHSIRTAYLILQDQMLPVLGKVLEKITGLTQYLSANGHILTSFFEGLGIAATIAARSILKAQGPLIALIAGLTLGINAIKDLIKQVEWFSHHKGAITEALNFEGKKLTHIVRHKFDALLSNKFGAFGEKFKNAFDFEDPKAIDVTKRPPLVLDSLQSPLTLFSNPVVDQDKVFKQITELNSQIQLASASPLASQTSNSISQNRSFTNNNKSTSITTGPITIETNATDADGIASSLASKFNNQLRQASANADDGIAM